MTLDSLDAFMERVAAEAFPCRHGHVSCSDRDGGRCCDELWQRQCDDETDEDYEERMAE